MAARSDSHSSLLVPIGTITRTSVDRQCLDQTRLCRWQELRERGEVAAAGDADPQRCVHVDADHMPARRKPQLPLANEHHIPGLMLLLVD
jgi:hypothetical protein